MRRTRFGLADTHAAVWLGANAFTQVDRIMGEMVQRRLATSQTFTTLAMLYIMVSLSPFPCAFLSFSST